MSNKINRRSFIELTTKSALGLSLAPYFVSCADGKKDSSPISTADDRGRMSIDKYLEIHDRLVKEDKAQELVAFIANYTPFEKGSSITQEFNTAHGPLNITLACETFLPKRGGSGIINHPTGATISQLHSGLGKYNANDPSNIKSKSKAAARDISLFAYSQHAQALGKTP